MSDLYTQLTAVGTDGKDRPVVTPEVRDLLIAFGRDHAKIDLNSDRYEYKDNWRVALLSDPKGVRQYEKQRVNGCCGSHDELIYTPIGLMLFGFNYGH